MLLCSQILRISNREMGVGGRRSALPLGPPLVIDTSFSLFELFRHFYALYVRF